MKNSTRRTFVWAASGEIDIMEAVNSGPDNNLVHATLHHGAAWPNNTSSGTSTTPPGDVWESFFTYAIEWEEGRSAGSWTMSTTRRRRAGIPKGIRSRRLSTSGSICC